MLVAQDTGTDVKQKTAIEAKSIKHGSGARALFPLLPLEAAGQDQF
jgi:hypothetical protein